MLYSDIKQQANAWNASFTEHSVDSISHLCLLADKAADIINKPHEDYPLRVPKTQEILLDFTSSLWHYGPMLFIRQAHHMLFSGDLEVSGIEGGSYRKHTAGNDRGHSYPDPINIPDLMDEFFKEFWQLDSKEMYKVFETIHPFSDGNGRVGGLLLFIHSLVTSGCRTVITPGQ